LAAVGSVEFHAAEVGCRTLHLYTDEAEPFYRALGWRVAERMSVDGEALVLMDKAVGQPTP
jgi:hypothetical protein